MSVLIALGIGALILLRLAVEGIQEMVVQYKVNKSRREQIEFEKQVGQAVLAYFEKEKEREEREAPPPGLTKEDVLHIVYLWCIGRSQREDKVEKKIFVEDDSVRWNHQAQRWEVKARSLDKTIHYILYLDENNEVQEEIVDEQRSQNAHS